MAAVGRVEEVEPVEGAHRLVALLDDVVLPEGRGRLREPPEVVLLLELLGGVEGDGDVPAGEGEREPLLQVLLEEERDLGVALLLQVTHDAVPAQVPLRKNFFDFS